ncbi:pantoate--beta-alanine ligase [Helicobacter bizzozeronii CIII-1]|uniref:Pantothenate synthetase n=1 Tax=Helicobacter bizzozeronii (strain CIII-1) TaxID=1002804 RepID=F8KSE1_HELBC|nr:pantoate--beta-alanine ligase [Helicobacter bizzozeronii]CCB79710.1 pantoate--beta-alanine ligase [Helicobacter bizzozeronii CIII-1]
MQVLHTCQELQAFRKSLDSVGFVPTMGALHPGHASLITRSKQENPQTIVSIFVNPTQFGPHEDLSCYPRDLEADLKLCQSLGVDGVFVPAVLDLYPFEPAITLNPAPDLLGYEAKNRPTHFNGVLQVVLKLFNLVRPQKAYFGKKDAQQLLHVQRLVADFFLEIEIVPCEIVRDRDGLALSSRNVYLSASQRQEALKIPLALERMQIAYQQGMHNTASLIQIGLDTLQGLKVHYLCICNHNLEPLAQIEPNKTLILCAVQVGTTRLLDNVWL